MKGEDIFKALEDTKDEMLEQCEKGLEKPKIRVWTKWVTAVASVCIVCAGAVAALNGVLSSSSSKSDDKSQAATAKITTQATTVLSTEKPDEKEVATPDGETAMSDDSYELDIAEVLPWDELKLNEQYNVFNYNDGEYFSTCGTLEDINEKFASDVNDTSHISFVENITIEGYEYIYDEQGETSKTHQINAELYSIEGISADAALLVHFIDADEYYVYKNENYNPATLGEFVEGLNLSENLEFDVGYGSHFDENNNYVSDKYSDGNTEALKNLLLSFSDAETVENFDEMTFETEISFGITDKIIGVENYSMSITADGYLTTNLMDVGRAYYIGEYNVKQIIDYVKNNFTLTSTTYENNEQEDPAYNADESETVETSVIVN